MLQVGQHVTEMPSRPVLLKSANGTLIALLPRGGVSDTSTTMWVRENAAWAAVWDPQRGHAWNIHKPFEILTWLDDVAPENLPTCWPPLGDR